MRALKDAKVRATDPFAYAFSGDYLLLATTQSEVDGYAKSAKHLSDSDTYAKAVDALGGDQLMMGWADVKGVYDALPE